MTNRISVPISEKTEAVDLLLKQRERNRAVAFQPVDRNEYALPSRLSDDLLYGADAIADFLFGDQKFRRKIYNLVDQESLPSFRLGSSICARKSILIEWISDQESSE